MLNCYLGAWLPVCSVQNSAASSSGIRRTTRAGWSRHAVQRTCWKLTHRLKWNLSTLLAWRRHNAADTYPEEIDLRVLPCLSRPPQHLTHWTKATLCNLFTFNNSFTIIAEDTYNHITVFWSCDVALWGNFSFIYEWKICLVDALWTPSDHHNPFPRCWLAVSHRCHLAPVAALLLPPVADQRQNVSPFFLLPHRQRGKAEHWPKIG